MFAALAASSAKERVLFHCSSKINFLSCPSSRETIMIQALLALTFIILQCHHFSVLVIPFITSSRVCHWSFFISFSFDIIAFPVICRSLLFQSPLLFLSLPSGPPSVAAAAERSSVLPAADAAAADQQRSTAEPGGCATGKGVSMSFLTLELLV